MGAPQFSNAIKFTPTGGAIGLDVVGDTRAHLVRFTVWDTGVGISQENQARVFEPFIQVDSGLARESAGTGLGLALVKRMIELHGGSIAVASEPEAGSRFIATLPWHQSDATTTMTRNTSLNERGDAPSQASRAMPALILLAEDNEINSMMMSDYLEVKGYRVIIARNGNEAIIQAHSTRPDMILMDIQMPGMDGLSAIRHLRADADLAPIPIIALTALAMLDDKERCFAAGATAYLSKPVNLKNLIAVLAAHLPQSQGAA